MFDIKEIIKYINMTFDLGTRGKFYKKLLCIAIKKNKEKL